MSVSFIEQDAVSKAVLFKLFLNAQTSDEMARKEDVAEEFEIPIGLKRITMSFETLSADGKVDFYPQAGRATITAAGYRHVEDGLRNKDSFFAKYAASGDVWLSKQTLISEAIPASDRIVLRSDNKPVFEEVSEELEAVISELNSDNLVGSELGDEREVIVAEAQAAKELIKPGRFHLSRLANLILPALKFLSEKFAGAAVGEAAKRLIALIMALF